MAWGERKKKFICLLIINPGQDGAKQLAVMNGVFRDLLGSDPKHPRVNDEEPSAQLVDTLPLVTWTTLDRALGEKVEDAPASSSFLLLETARANFGYKIGACCTEAGFGNSSCRAEHLPGESREETTARGLQSVCEPFNAAESPNRNKMLFFFLMQRKESSLDSALAVNRV